MSPSTNSKRRWALLALAAAATTRATAAHYFWKHTGA